MKKNLLIFCRKIINKIGFNNRKKHINVPCGQDTDFFEYQY